MRQLPRGTVTLLFTDVEGSTRLLQELGRDRYVAALTEHRRLLREAFGSHDGVEVEMQGDSFHFAFVTALEAVLAAAEAQGALAAHEWQDGPIRVRIGIHSGTPLVSDDLYAGIDVHRAARVMQAGHGGQVLLSHSTAELVSGELPRGLALRDLGEHRLKDLTLAQRLWQLCGEGLARDFRPPNTLENRPTNLPMQPTPLVGRERELVELQSLLAQDGVRLVTVTGPGGAGKTRLALQAAAESLESFPGGTWFVNLAALVDPGHVLPAVGQTLALREEPGRPMLDTLVDALVEREVLLLLDNFEQVAGAAPQLAELLARTRRVRLLVTSRSSLRLSGEHEYATPALDSDQAVALFAERARAAKHTFSLNGNRQLVREICRHLDNLPLAIELAAARIKLLPEQALLERLDRRLMFLTGGARDLDQRQQTLRAAIDWSYDLLTSDEQTLFRRLAVFAGGRILEAVDEICNLDCDLDIFEGVASLVDKSLLRQEEGTEGAARFVMLETIHEYATELLEQSGEGDSLRRRHAGWFLALVEEAQPRLRGDTAESSERLDRLEAEHDNIRAALGWGEAHERTLALRLATAVAPAWETRGYWREAQEWLERLLDGSDRLFRAKALRQLGSFAMLRGALDQAQLHYEEALELARALGDTQTSIELLNGLGSADVARRDFAAGRARYEEMYALARQTGDERGLAAATESLGNLALSEYRFADAAATFDKAVLLFRQLPDDVALGHALTNAAFAALHLGDTHRPRELLREALVLFRRLGFVEGIIYASEGMAAVAAVSGDARRAAVLLASSETLADEVGLALEPFEQEMHDRALASARKALGEHFDAAWAEGAQLTRERLVEEALR